MSEKKISRDQIESDINRIIKNGQENGLLCNGELSYQEVIQHLSDELEALHYPPE